jgi:hypothetical protein
MLLGFILIIGLWGALLLPGVLGEMRARPGVSTRRHHQSTAVLAAVSTTEAGRVMLANRRASGRRRQTLMLLGGGALVTLAMAALTGSVIWLLLTFVLDLAVGGFVGALLAAKQTHPVTQATVIPIRAEQLTDSARVESSSVRILAGAR